VAITYVEDLSSIAPVDVLRGVAGGSSVVLLHRDFLEGYCCVNEEPRM